MRLVLLIQLLSACALRWHLTTATLKTEVEYLLGQMVIASENWHREGALARHFIPSRSIDQRFPEWSYRDDYWRDYLSQPPLAFMLHYWATELFGAADPVVVGKLLAQVQIAAGVLIAAGLLYDVFGLGATVAGLSFLIWGQPFLVWFIDGYYSTTTAMVCQLVLVSWCVAFFARELAATDDRRRVRWRDLLTIGLLAYLGTFSEWVALFGNAVASLAFLILGACIHLTDSTRAWKAYAVAMAIVVGSAAAEATTVLLYGTKVGFAFYLRAFTDRVETRTGTGGVLEYTSILIPRMAASWPRSMLIVLVVMALVVCAFAAVALGARPNNDRRAPSSRASRTTTREFRPFFAGGAGLLGACSHFSDTLLARDGVARRRADGGMLLLSMVLGFGGAATYCYRLKNLVEIHWWFTGTWTIGWVMTICCFGYVAGWRRARLSASPNGDPERVALRSVVCAVLTAGAIGWNLSFVDLRVRTDRVSHDLYRMIGRALPHDGYPLIVADMPGLFEEYPYPTAYLRRPVVRYNSSGDPNNLSGNLLVTLGVNEDVTSNLLNRYGFARDLVYVAYDPAKRQCAFAEINLPQPHPTISAGVCRVPADVLLHNPASLWSTSVSPTEVKVGSEAGTFAVRVSAPDTWPWSAVPHGDFIGLASPPQMTGTGTAIFTVQPNAGFARQSSVTVAERPVPVTQAGAAGFAPCVSEVRVQERWRALGGIRTAAATVVAPPVCLWVATSTVPWIRVSRTSAVGDGQFGYTVFAHVGANQRSGRVSAGGKTVEITELGCPYTISAISVPATAEGGTVRLSLTGECSWPWTVVSEDSFIRVLPPSTGTGDGVATFVVAKNTGAAREGRLRIAGYTVKVAQRAIGAP